MSVIHDDEGNAMRGCLWSLAAGLLCWAVAIYLILWIVREFSR